MRRKRPRDRLAECCHWCGGGQSLQVVKVREGLVVTLCRPRCVALLNRALDGDDDQAFMLRALARRTDRAGQ